MLQTALKTAVLLAVVAILLGSATPASASSVLIGFEEFGNVGTSGPAITNQYASDDVLFSSNGGFFNQVSSQSGIAFGLNFICTGNGSINCTQETILTFTTPVNDLSFYQVGDNSSGTVALVDVYTNNTFNSTQNILGDDIFTNPNLVDLTAFTDVTKIRIYGITDPGGLGWDNFSFNTSTTPVPEPSSLMLLAFGMLAICALRYLPSFR